MTINCKGKLLDLSAPKVMGILNVTPNSFFDGGRYFSEAGIVTRAGQILEEGAAIIDIGGYSSRPDASEVSEEEELKRVTDAVRLTLRHYPDAIISVDTFRSSVAAAAVDNGAAIVNDISAGHLDPEMLPAIARLRVPYIMMHMRGNPQTMQQLTNYDNVVGEVLFYFSERIARATELGINDLVIDPGFGFAKTLSQNYQIMRKLELLRLTELPILVGVSRKSMIYRPLEIESKDALNGTTALNMVALSKGAHILRVHDVKEAVECVKLHELLLEAPNGDDRVRSSES